MIVHLHKNCNSDLFAAVGKLELTLTQIKLLHHLDDAADALTLKDAAEAVLVSLPAASRTVDDLVRRGYVERQEDAEDRRIMVLALTPAGSALLGEAREAMSELARYQAVSLPTTSKSVIVESPSQHRYHRAASSAVRTWPRGASRVAAA